MTPAQLAARFGVTTRTARRWATTGRPRAVSELLALAEGRHPGLPGLRVDVEAGTVTTTAGHTMTVHQLDMVAWTRAALVTEASRANVAEGRAAACERVSVAANEPSSLLLLADAARLL